MSLVEVYHDFCIKDFYFTNNELYFMDTKDKLYFSTYVFPRRLTKPQKVADLEPYILKRNLKVI